MINSTTDHFASYGAQLFKGALKPCMGELLTAVEHVPIDEAGVRLHGIEALRPLLASEGCLGAVAATVLGAGAKPVRAILFNKSSETNWSLAWHQDRTICVKEKREVPGFGPWTVKSGMIHVAPPFDLLTRMVTLRAHLDDVPVSNAPLLIAPGSHTLGRIAVDEIEEAVKQCGTATCIADAGDVWLYATSILHASEAASIATSRRVLQVDFAAEVLPHGLEWLGI
ncbi:phytanoyl-CoA dioxygenase family protein [Altericroceibacterium xinjiangense]|uniref:phytanoyl-CoA dioxygenase family protein n=1 Tax=Altericroceibacterium xinjiangense TaxID=762261 RepID=UPI000F7D7344|nr:phytanoyl-CoA dioxygenase family protein [Altericroceibacterium xinjiangense]